MIKLLNIVSAIALFATTSTYADVNINSNTTNSQPSKKKEKPFFEQGMTLKDDKVQHNELYPAAYSAPASIHVDNGKDLNANISFLYWYMGQDAMDVAYTPGVAAPGTVLYQKQGYNPGFQIGLGMDSGFDDWKMNTEYTWYHNSETLTPTTSDAAWSLNNFFLSTVGSAPAPLAQAKWKLRMDLLDLVAGRPFYQGRTITVSPSGGLRALWLRQNERISMTGFAPEQASNTTSRSWALGVVGNIDGRVLIWKGLRIDSVMGASLLYTKYTTLANTSNIAGFTSSSSTSRSALRPTMDMGLGLGYGAYCMGNKFFVDLSARYDFNIFWSQNMMRSFVTQAQGIESGTGDLILHGLTANLRCDF